MSDVMSPDIRRMMYNPDTIPDLAKIEIRKDKVHNFSNEEARSPIPGDTMQTSLQETTMQETSRHFLRK